MSTFRRHVGFSGETVPVLGGFCGIGAESALRVEVRSVSLLCSLMADSYHRTDKTTTLPNLAQTTPLDAWTQVQSGTPHASQFVQDTLLDGGADCRHGAARRRNLHGGAAPERAPVLMDAWHRFRPAGASYRLK